MKKSKISTVILIISAVITLGICAVMNLYLIPGIEKSAGGLTVFDMNTFGYTYEQAKAFVSALTPDGLSLYLHIQLPLDFFYPVAYTACFVLCLIKLKSKKATLALPAILAVCDYAENILSIKMLTGEFSKLTANIAAGFTVVKSLVMYAVIAIILVLFVLRLVKRRKTVDNL